MSWWKKALCAILIAVSGYEVGKDRQGEKIEELAEKINQHRETVINHNESGMNISHIIIIIVMLLTITVVYSLIKSYFKYKHNRITAATPRI